MMPKSVITSSGERVISTPTRCPGRRPRACRPAAMARAPRATLARVVEVPRNRRAGSSGSWSRRARISSCTGPHGTGRAVAAFHRAMRAALSSSISSRSASGLSGASHMRSTSRR